MKSSASSCGNRSRSCAPIWQTLAWLILVLIAGFLLSGCASGTRPAPASPAARIPPNLLTLCPELPAARSGRLEDLEDNHQAIAHLYHECRDRHRQLADRLR